MKITTLAGGVGAAKLLSGLVEVVPREQVTAIVNTGDDFDWMGLRVCPDIDTVMYTLSGEANPATGWGVHGDSFRMLEQLARLGGPRWFRIGDLDVALHLLRTEMLRSGMTLADTTREISTRIGVRCHILPMTDSYVPTQVRTDEGLLGFQDYFVRRRCEPQVRGFVFCNSENSTPAPGVLDAIRTADVVVVCPSNPFVSIGPILAVPQVREVLRCARERVLAVSPLISGRAIKGPTADMLCQLGYEVSSTAVAGLYRDFAGVFVVDTSDSALSARIVSLGLTVKCAPILMDTQEARTLLARRLLEMVP